MLIVTAAFCGSLDLLHYGGVVRVVDGLITPVTVGGSGLLYGLLRLARRAALTDNAREARLVRHHALLEEVVLRLGGGLSPVLTVICVESVRYVTRVVGRVCVLPCAHLAVPAVLRRIATSQLGAFVHIQTDRRPVRALHRRLLWLLPRAEDLLGAHSTIGV